MLYKIVTELFIFWLCAGVSLLLEHNMFISLFNSQYSSKYYFAQWQKRNLGQMERPEMLGAVYKRKIFNIQSIKTAKKA